jgi:hypothetical protein
MAETATPAEMLRQADQVEQDADYQASRDKNWVRAEPIAELRRIAARIRHDYGGHDAQPPT